MYSIDWGLILRRTNWRRRTADADARGTSRAGALSPTVWALGFTSFFTDISSEMVASILPVYLVLHLQLSPLAFGFIDGLYAGVAALVRIVAGVLSDRWHRRKEIAASGYALSAACRVLILLAGAAWSTIAAVVALDRIGKGIRTAPRDALISQRTDPASFGRAFGLHRSLDAAGAMLGPLLAFVLLALIPGGFDVLFVASFGLAIIGLATIILFVPGTTMHDRRTAAARPLSFGSAAGLLLDARFRRVVIAGTALAAVTLSDGFIFLVLQEHLDFTAVAFPLLYVATSLVAAILSAPVGALSDRIGRRRVLLGGYVVLGGVYGSVAFAPGSLVTAVATVLLLGAFYAATEGVLAAIAAAALPDTHRGTGLAVLATGTNIARFFAAVAFGWLWTVTGLQVATIAAVSALAIGTIGAAAILRSADTALDETSGQRHA